MGSVEFIFAIIVPMVSVWSLEKHLITNLYHRFAPKEQETEHLKKMSPHERRFEEIKLSIKERQRIAPAQLPVFIDFLRTYLMKCCKSLKYKDDDFFTMKAKLRLSKELDV